MDNGIRELLLQALGQTPENVPLYLSPGDLGIAGMVKAIDIANANGVGVVAGAVILKCKDGKNEALRDESL